MVSGDVSAPAATRDPSRARIPFVWSTGRHHGRFANQENHPMRKQYLSLVLAAVATSALAASAAHAQSRTWVSAGGDDNNPCSRAAPCKTFAGAIDKTQAGG